MSICVLLFNRTTLQVFVSYLTGALYVNLCDDQMLIAWPSRSQDATPCDFFLGGYVKDQIYVPPLPARIPELKARIRIAIETITADMLQTVWNELDYRVDVCTITKGAHIEQL
jgi:hypothetical protein